MEFKITSMELLGDVREKYMNKLTLKVESERVTDELIRDLGLLIKANPGKCKVNLQLVSQAENMAVDLPSRSLSAGITEDLVSGLDGMAEVSYALN